MRGEVWEVDSRKEAVVRTKQRVGTESQIFKILIKLLIKSRLESTMEVASRKLRLSTEKQQQMTDRDFHFAISHK